MKTISMKALSTLLGLMLFTTDANANISSKLQQFMGNEFSNLQGLYVMSGVIVASLVLYVLVNHYGKEKENQPRISRNRSASHNHHRRHHHRIIKKMS